MDNIDEDTRASGEEDVLNSSALMEAGVQAKAQAFSKKNRETQRQKQINADLTSRKERPKKFPLGHIGVSNRASSQDLSEDELRSNDNDSEDPSVAYQRDFAAAAPTRSELNSLQQAINVLDHRVKQNLDGAEPNESKLVKRIETLGSRLLMLETNLKGAAKKDRKAKEQLTHSFRALMSEFSQIQELCNAKMGENLYSVSTLYDRLKEIEKNKAAQEILSLLDKNKNFSDEVKQTPSIDQESLQKKLKTHEDNMKKAVKYYIEVVVAHASRPVSPAFGLGIQMQEALQQLNEIMRKASYHITSNAPGDMMTWLNDPHQTPAKRKALKSVEHFSHNPVLQYREDDKDLEKHLATVQALTQALFFITNYDQIAFNDIKDNGRLQIGLASVDGESSDDDEGYQHASEALNESFMSIQSNKSQNGFTLDVESKRLINVELMKYIKGLLHDLPELKGGRFGQEKDNLQFWGKVVVVLSTALLLSVSAVAIASLVGFTAPAAYLMTYVTAAKSISMVSAVLEFVAAKLSVDITAAAAVTTISASAALTGFGMFAQYMGGAPSFKRDMVKAAQGLEAVIDSPKFGN